MKKTSWLRAARLATGLSQAALAARAGCHQGTISLHEQGRLTATPEFERALLLGLSQGPALPYLDSDDLRRPAKELLAEALACREALQVIARAIGAGQGDRQALLALVESVTGRMRMIERAVDLRMATRNTSSRRRRVPARRGSRSFAASSGWPPGWAGFLKSGC